MDKGDGNHELTSHHTLGNSIILTEVGRVNKMNNDATSQSSHGHGMEQLTAEEEVILLKRRVEELKLQLKVYQEDKSVSAN